MKKILLILATAFFAVNSFATIHNISVSGLTYSPATLEANVGDTVMFTITANHPTLQVTETSWNNNGTAAMIGGFGNQTSSFQIIIEESDAPTIYYVCTNHVGAGMKGLINVTIPFLDADADGVEDDDDNCPDMSNADQADLDSDDIGDVCDDDMDGDGVDNDEDAFPMDDTETSDNDDDGTGDNADLDDDNDGCSDIDEIAGGTDPLTAGDCTVSIDELNDFGTIEVFPTPANDVVTIRTSSIISTILIHDISGKLVQDSYIQGSEVSLQISNLENGVYFLQVFNTEGNTTIKRILKK